VNFLSGPCRKTSRAHLSAVLFGPAVELFESVKGLVELYIREFRGSTTTNCTASVGLAQWRDLGESAPIKIASALSA